MFSYKFIVEYAQKTKEGLVYEKTTIEAISLKEAIELTRNKYDKRICPAIITSVKFKSKRDMLVSVYGKLVD